MGKIRDWVSVAAGVTLTALVIWQIGRLANRVDALGAEVKALDREHRPAAVAAAPAACQPAFAKQVAVEIQALGREADRDQPAPPSEDNATTPPTTQGLASANQIVDQAIQHRHLTRDSVRLLRQTLADAPAAEADEVRRRIAAALDRNELVPDDDRDIFP